jgi:hypothetical protein
MVELKKKIEKKNRYSKLTFFKDGYPNWKCDRR